MLCGNRRLSIVEDAVERGSIDNSIVEHSIELIIEIPAEILVSRLSFLE